MKKKLIWVGIVALIAAACIWFLRPHPTPTPTSTPRPQVRAVQKTSPKIKLLPKQPIVVSKTSRMAIVLDDWGNNYNRLSEALAVNRPLTLAILPHLLASERIARDAHDAGLGVMLHIPMEPFTTTDNLEPHTIKVSMPDAQVIQYLDAAIASIPYAEGVNNHMGSRATADVRVMKLMLGRIFQKGLFFIDSNVSPKTVGESVARQIGIRFGKREVFIDNETSVESIQRQIREAIRVARQNGHVIVIGHDRKVTLATIAKMVPEIEKNGVKLVLARELVSA